MRQISARLTAAEIARRKFRERNQAFSYSGSGAVGVLVEPHHFGFERRAGVVDQRRRLLGEAAEHLRIDAVDQVELAAREPHQLDLAVLLDVQADGVEVRQAAAGGIRLPVVRIALQKNLRSRRVAAPRRTAPTLPFLLRGARRENGYLVEQTLEPGHRRWKHDSDLILGRNHRFHIARGGAERVASGRMQRRVHQGAHGVCDIIRRERRSVGKENARPQPKRDGPAVLRDFPREWPIRARVPG